MSVVVYGMKMPNSCRECPFEQFYANCGETRCRATNAILAINYHTLGFDGRHIGCPLEEWIFQDFDHEEET